MSIIEIWKEKLGYEFIRGRAAIVEVWGEMGYIDIIVLIYESGAI